MRIGGSRSLNVRPDAYAADTLTRSKNGLIGLDWSWVTRAPTPPSPRIRVLYTPM